MPYSPNDMTGRPVLRLFAEKRTVGGRHSQRNSRCFRCRSKSRRSRVTRRVAHQVRFAGLELVYASRRGG